MLYLVEPERLGELFPAEPGFRASQLHRWLYRTPVMAMADMTNLPSTLRDSLENRLWPFVVEAERVGDQGATRKWLFRATDGASYESVLMGYGRRATLCLSSQAGCALGCTFCATGQFGFERHLEAGEMVAQVAYAAAFLRQVGMAEAPDHLTNVVFMGMGEPLANYDRVREALRRIIEVMGISARSVTVSTVGVVPGMRRLADDPWPVNLAVSLHAADDQLRTRLVPLNKRYPLAEVEAAALHYFEKTHRRLSIEWTMIDGINDTPEQAYELVPLARRWRAHVNLIPMNPTPLSADRPSPPRRIERFMEILREGGVNVTLRDTRGRGIEGACGQLRVAKSAPAGTSG